MPKTWKVINDDKKNKDEGDNNKDDNNKDDRDNKVENDKTNFPPYSAAWRASSGSARGRAAVCRSPEISICSRRRRPGILRIYHICYIYWGCIIHLQKTNDLGIYHSSDGKILTPFLPLPLVCWWARSWPEFTAQLIIQHVSSWTQVWIDLNVIALRELHSYTL